MRVRIPVCIRQAWFLSFFLLACSPGQDQVTVEPPPTHPLSLPVIGYGVVSVSYALLMDEPGAGGVSLGYARRGSTVKVVERRVVNNGSDAESWVLVEGGAEGPGGGWIREIAVDIYENEYKANTASELMKR
jgi:hypothetical protein